jgi:VanZ family protein
MPGAGKAVILKDIEVLHWWQRRPAWLQPLCAFGVMFIVAGLFIGGAQPIAVGLFAEPWDKVAHGCVFAVLAVLLTIALQGAHLLHGRAAITTRLALWLALVGASLVGGADEIHQIWLPGRSAGWDDWLADTLGAAAGLMMWRWLQRAR